MTRSETASLKLNAGSPLRAVNGWPFSSKVTVIAVPRALPWTSKPAPP